MGLAIRMILYAFFAFMAGSGWAEFNESTGDFTFNVNFVVDVLVWAIGFVGTFFASRWAKARDGLT